MKDSYLKLIEKVQDKELQKQLIKGLDILLKNEKSDAVSELTNAIQKTLKVYTSTK